MKKLLSFILCALLLASCGTNPKSVEPAITVPATTTESPTAAPTENTIISTTPSTEPVHSTLYISMLDVEDVIDWFNEVCLGAEFVNSGDPSFLQKWDRTISYMVHGDPTDDDLATLESFTQWLNTVNGFPGIIETEDPLEANLNIHFCTQLEMLSKMGDWAHDLDGAVTFWYEDNRIYDATICIRTDLSQHLRNSVIMEELYNGLGPIQDTSLRPDSIIYAEFSEPQELTETDKLILQLLYHPQMQCGMNADQCEEVIRMLYY